MKKEIVIISGASGAGKTLASVILEDMGYRCIDQYPCELLAELVELLEDESNKNYNKVALTISLFDLEKFDNILTNSVFNSTLIVLDTKKEELLNRYKFTRRIHPLLLSNMAKSIEEAIDIEKTLIDKYRQHNAHIIDTTKLNKIDLKDQIEHILNKEDEKDLSISFESFGFKHGVPTDADIVFDCRILANPYYEDELRNLTGDDDRVKEYVMNGENTKEFLDTIIKYLDLTFKSYDGNDRRHLMVCVGCTGGQHRSVTIANYLFNHYKDIYKCYLSHRER